MSREFAAIDVLCRSPDTNQFEIKHLDLQQNEIRTLGDIFRDLNIPSNQDTSDAVPYLFDEIILSLRESNLSPIYQIKITDWVKTRFTSKESLLYDLNKTFFAVNLEDRQVGKLEIKEAYGVDLIYWDFKVKPVNASVHPSIPTPDEDQVDLMLTKEGVDYQKLASCSLFTVGGLVHRAYGEHDGIFIKDGRQTTLMQKGHHVGIISFEDMAEVKIVDIDSSVHYQDLDPHLSHEEGFYLVFPGLDFSNKTVGLSLGGFLHFDDGVDQLFYPINHNTLRVNMKRFSWFHRIYTILEELDPKKLNMIESDEKVLNVSQARSEETLKAMLDLSQTFLIILEHQQPLHFFKESVSRLTWPKRYQTRYKKHLPLRLGDGRFPSYHFIDEGKGFVINTIDNRKFEYFDDFLKRKENKFLTRYKRTTKKWGIQHAHFYRVQSYRYLPLEEK